MAARPQIQLPEGSRLQVPEIVKEDGAGLQVTRDRAYVDQRFEALESHLRIAQAQIRAMQREIDDLRADVDAE